MTKKVKVKKETINSETLQQVLIKKALGYKVKESTNEYALVDNEYKLIKKKVSVKYTSFEFVQKRAFLFLESLLVIFD